MSDLAHKGRPAHPASSGRHHREAVRPQSRASGDRGESPAQTITDSRAPCSPDRAACAPVIPYVGRLIGTMRREFLDHVLFWTAHDLERKLADFQAYYNAARRHASLEPHAVDLRRHSCVSPTHRDCDRSREDLADRATPFDVVYLISDCLRMGTRPFQIIRVLQGARDLQVVLRQNRRGALAGHRAVSGIDSRDDRDRWQLNMPTRGVFVLKGA